VAAELTRPSVQAELDELADELNDLVADLFHCAFSTIEHRAQLYGGCFDCFHRY
jgi:hypothetical protein